MKSPLRKARRRAGDIRRRLLEPPEKAAWRRAWCLAEDSPRFVGGSIRMVGYELRYPDLLNFCAQWEDIFVLRHLVFQAGHAAPRILDCGANIGLASLFFKSLYPQAHITAFEADPGVHELLMANLRANGAGDVVATHAAVWISSGTLTFHCDGTDSGMIGALPGSIDGIPTVVPSIRLRDLLESDNWDLLKIDIEGAEDTVLADCEPVLHRVSTLLLDLHEFDPARRQAPAVLQLLARNGFSYSIEQFVALPWRPPVAGADTPFPGSAMTWAMTVRAWRPGC
jgi:FkbM family methyltransferase